MAHNQSSAGAVAICAIIRDEARYVEEWVEFHRKQGVVAWRVYDNGSTDDTVKILRSLGIEPVIWAGKAPNFDDQQRAAYLEGARMLLGDAEWVAFIDADEFVFGRSGKTLTEALSEVPSDVGAIAVQQRVFGSSGHQAITPGGVLDRFTRSAGLDCPEHKWFKSIARPGLVKSFDSVHSVALSTGRYVMVDGSPLSRDGHHPGEASHRADGPIGLHHYPLKSLEEFREKQKRWSDRQAATRFDEGYFFKRDTYANESECLELTAPTSVKVESLEFIPSPPSIKVEAHALVLNPHHPEQKRRRCVFTSAGDRNNVASWVAGLEHRDWDLVVAFYGDDDQKYEELRKISKASFRIKGGKFPNLKTLHSRYPALFTHYEFVWVTDDDLIIDPPDIDRLFKLAARYDFWVSQPAFSHKGQIAHPVTAWDGNGSNARIVSFVEVTCPLFRADKLWDFFEIYDGELVGWGTDWWFCNFFQSMVNFKLAVIDEVVVTNPFRKGGVREIHKLQSDEMRVAKWKEVARSFHLSEYPEVTLARITAAQA